MRAILAPICLTLGVSSFLSSFTYAQEVQATSRTLRGVLLERGTRKPLEGVNVFVLPARLRATTDTAGRFEITGPVPDEFTWVVNATGYKRLERESRFPNQGNEASFQLFLEKTSYQVFETTVVGKEARRDDAKKTLKASEFINLPGSGGDPIKAVQNLPGVNRAAPFNAQVIIQGSAPNDTAYLIDGHEVPIIFHFGGLSSVVTPEAIDRVDYLSAGYGPEYGRALGGLVGVWTKTPRRDRLGGFAYVDTFNSGFLLEGPAGEDASFLVSARQSYIGAVLKKVLGNNERFNLTVAPDFRDFTGIYEKEVDAKNTAKLVAVASQDRLEFLLSQPIDADPAFRGKFENETSFFRLIPQWTHRHGEGLTSRWSLGVGKDWVSIDAGDIYFFLQAVALTTRLELEKVFSPLWTSQLGLDNTFTSFRVDLSLISDNFEEGGVGNPFSSGQRVFRNVKGDATQAGLYLRNEFKPSSESPWTFLPNIRGDYFSATKEAFASPRLGVRYQISDSLSMRSGTGLYVQAPQPQEVDRGVGNPDIRSPKAVHAMLGFDKDFRKGARDGFVWSGGGFYRQFYDLVNPSSRLVFRDGALRSENYNNNGKGRAYGAETLLKLQDEDWTGWLSYTLSRSVRWSKTNPSEIPFEFDQTHLMTAILARQLPRNWRLSTRLRYATGNPNTPVTGAIFDADNDVYVPIRGGIYSERLEPFYQLDVRVDKKWIFNKWVLSAYLDIQNVTNRENLEAVRYSYDFSKKTQISGLPILPTFGLKGEF